MTLIERAKTLLLMDDYYLDDARRGLATHNTLCGSVLASLGGYPRWATETAVRKAVAEIDAARLRPKRQ